jgi:hypothetical protein
MTTGQETSRKNRDTRRAYREKREAQIQELAARLDLWEAKLRKAAAEGEIRYREELEQLRSKLEIARVRLSLLKDAGEAAWQEIRDGLDDAVDDLRRAVRKAASKFE